MSERWKPKKGEKYWVIDNYAKVWRHTYSNDTYDSAFYSVGNCFRTEAEARSAAKKFKDLMLSLHEPTTDCSQVPKIEVDDRGVVLDLKPLPDTLPKLTTEVFDRPDCPAWAQYAAVTRSGNGIYFSGKPYPDDISGVWHDSIWDFIRDESRSAIKWDASDWKNSLIERPSILPDWCRVGEWCYCLDDDGNDKYFKITQIKDNFIYGEDWDIDYHFVKQARPRPYNAEEMRGLVGKVVDNDHGSTFLVTAFVPDNGGGVCIDGVVYNAEDLRACFGVGSKTCEKLEHLNEKGEWVE